jgi:pilus assembly protein CpaB
MGVSGGDEGGENASPTPVTFDSNTIATLELTPSQAETLINASMRGQLSLTLRSVVDFGKTADAQRPPNTSQAVRVIRFGKEQSVLAGSTAGSAYNQPEFIPSSDVASSGGYDPSGGEIQVDAVEPQLMPQ